MKIVGNKTPVMLTNAEAFQMIPEDTPEEIKSVFFKSSNALCNIDKINQLKINLSKFKLSEFEIVSLINIMPVGLVHLQNIIEDMVDRLTENEMQEILDLMKCDL